jgi:hypothetical protein
MARKPIDIGTIGNDGTGDSIRDAFRKVNDNFRELYSSLGLGERLKFIGLDDTPNSYEGQGNSILVVNPDFNPQVDGSKGVVFKSLEGGSGIQIDFTSNENSVLINNLFSDISADPSPNLGGPLNAVFGSDETGRSPIGNIVDLRDAQEVISAREKMTSTHGVEAANTDRFAANKGYVDDKISLAGVDSIDPATGATDTSWGVMTGPLVLARDPEPEDDQIWNGLTAATKRYVDNSGFGSTTNLYVATSGNDDRQTIDRKLQGRSLATAYRTIEAALKKAEELVLESPIAMGPYRKVLTFNNGQGTCTLKSIGEVADSGSGFSGQLFMSVESISINNPGSLYLPGDIVDVVGGTFLQAAKVEILSVNVLAGTGGRGSVKSLRIITSGVYTALPGSVAVTTTPVSPGTGLTLNITYNVNNIQVLEGGSGYGLVSVRIVGGGGTGAFGRADVVNSEIVGITVTNRGTGFTSLPNVIVNLPRFFIDTQGFRTDFTGNVLSDNPDALRTRDIREGLLLRGETSGALAIILAHTGELSQDSETLGSEIFDVDLIEGEFQLNEVIAYGDVTKNIQISVLIESGIYEENYPLRIPQNVAIIGNEFRRCLVKPKNAVSGAPLSGVSSSPWAGIYFRRDPVFDGMNVADDFFGYHYLTDSSKPIYPLINNRGEKRAAAELLDLNREFIKNQVIGWINHQIDNDIAPFADTFEYNQDLCRRDVGLIIDAVVFDLKYGGYSRSISAALKYFASVSSLKAITDQLDETVAGIERLEELAQLVITNAQILDLYTIDGQAFDLTDPDSNLTLLVNQTLDQAFVAETDSSRIIEELIDAVIDIISNSNDINYPKNNNSVDVFLCNDANIIRAVTCQGHSGFMMVLDPEGQVLTKSPYCQESACFSLSTGRKTFAGGMLVDGFTGNQQFRILEAPEYAPGLSNTLTVDGLLRPPQTPCSFIVNDIIYRVNYIRNYNYAIDFPTTESDGKSQWFSSVQLILDETTPWPFGVFEYDQDLCYRDVGLIINGLSYDLIFQTNYHQIRSGISYRQIAALKVVEEQLNITLKGIKFAHDQAASFVNFNSDINESYNTISTIIDLGENSAPILVLTDPPGVSSNISNSKNLLLSNIDFIKAEAIGWIDDQITNNTAPFTTGFTYDSVRYSRDFGFVVGAVAYDLLYSGNSQSRDIALRYYDGLGDNDDFQYNNNEKDKIAAAIDYIKYLCQQVILNQDPVPLYSSEPRVPGTPGTASEVTIVQDRLDIVENVVLNGPASAPSLSLPNLSLYSYNSDRLSAKTELDNRKIEIQDSTIFFINLTANQFEILMPGNRSMLSNDFTQVCDLGYGLVVANGGLTEAVSMFTYYCQISYYAVTGGQIRSIGGSASHGNYALVAEGSDPLEVPTPVSLYHQLSQGATVFASTVTTLNAKGGVQIFVIYDDYLPLNGSELEINHNNQLVRYAVNNVELVDQAQKLARINISSAGGFVAAVPNGQRITIRQNIFVVLTGNVVDVATRPSTALVLNEANFVYRILEFTSYNETFDADVFTIVDINLSTGVITTDVPHRQLVGYEITFRKEAGDILPTAIVASEEGPPAISGTVYTVHSVISPTEFIISSGRFAPPLDLSAGPAYGGTQTAIMRPFGLALTQLRENYNYVVSDLFAVQPFASPGSLTSCTITSGAEAVINAVGHGLRIGDQIRFSFTAGGSLPLGISEVRYYWVSSKDFTVDSFKITDSPPIDSVQIGVGGVLTGNTISGLTVTEQLIPGQRLFAKSSTSINSVTGDGAFSTITFDEQRKPPFLIGQDIEISGVTDTGFNEASVEVVSCTTTTVTYASSATGTSSGGTVSPIQTGNLGTDPVIASVPSATSIVISNSGGASDGSVVFDIEGAPNSAGSTGANVVFGKLLGDQGENTVAIVDLPEVARLRVLNSVFVYEGTEYQIVGYQQRPGGALYSVLTLDKPLEISLISFNNPIAVKSSVDRTSSNALGTLTIRIALVRVTSHDFLEIGTGSYADTNYPNDIFGPAVNDFNTVPLYATNVDVDGLSISRAQIQERDVGRVFFVTTDQYGNFSVGPFFKVDQGTGTVTFAASIALSQLDGLGFKRGATIAEFSVDDSMADAANDAVPTEGAVRNYIDRRLGVSHFGININPDNLIPTTGDGGFMALSGQLSMKGDMNLGNFKISNLGQPTLNSDAARLDSIKISNLKDDNGNSLFDFNNIQASQLLALTGIANEIRNVTPTGDIEFNLIPGIPNQIRTEITADAIVNADINPSAAIVQSKLNMQSAGTRANASGITQADRGLASFDSAQFNATDGWISIKDNGIALAKIAQIGTQRLLGNPSTTVTGNISAIQYSTVVDEGNAVKKSQFGQFGSTTGFLRRIDSGNEDSRFTTVEAAAAKTGSTLAIRDVNGDFAGRQITADALRVATTTTGVYTVLRSNEITTTRGSTELFGYGGGGGSSFVGIGIEAGSQGTDNRSVYNNTTHLFRNQAGTTTYATLSNTGLDLGARSITATTLTTGAAGTNGTITGTWRLSAGSTFHATYAADLAEYYEGDKEYEVGTVLIFGGDKEVTISSLAEDTRVAGVVSDRAAYSMNGSCPGHKNQIALQGRVPVKVVGKIAKGTILVTSNIPGIAVAAGEVVKPGTMIGKALENYDSNEIGTIEVAVGRT